MSPYRQPPPQPRAAPRAPWWRVAWAVLARGLQRRRFERALRHAADADMSRMVHRVAHRFGVTGWDRLHPFTRRRVREMWDREEAKVPWRFGHGPMSADWMSL